MMTACSAAQEEAKVATVSTEPPAGSAPSAAPKADVSPNPAELKKLEKAASDRPATPKKTSLDEEVERMRALLDAAANSSQGGSQGSVLTGTLGGVPVAGLSLGGPGSGGGSAIAGGSGSPAVGTAVVRGPVVNATVPSPVVTGGSVANADIIVAGMAAGFRRCANASLATNPNNLQSGATMVFSARVDANGAVDSVVQKTNKGVPTTAASCMSARIASAQFAPPSGNAALIEIVVTFQVTQP